SSPKETHDEPVDWSEALKVADGDRDLLKELVQLVLDQFPTLLAQIHEALSRGDAPTFHRAAHTMTGSMRSVGIKAAAERAHQLENLGRNGELGQAPEILTLLESEIARLTPVLVSVA